MYKYSKSQSIELVEKLIRQELNEMSVTGDIAGYQTPYAFSGGRKKDKKKRKRNATNSTGYEIVREAIESSDIPQISKLIRLELASLFYDLFRKRRAWM
tara:strand:- start:1810 stop:2106 length:297 start_codon:yes stop_codon:yes gene_type:complete